MTETATYLDLAAVGRILGDERYQNEVLAGKEDAVNEPIPPGTVRTYVWRFTDPDSGYRKAHLRNSESDPNAALYKANPMPAPNGPPGAMIWIPGPGQTTADIEQALRYWQRNRPGKTGRPKKPATSRSHKTKTTTTRTKAST